jgi:hypothetical protein
MLDTPWQQKVFTKLIGFQYKIVYRKGSDNGPIDSLSHRTRPPTHLLAIAIQSYIGDELSTNLVTKLSVDPDSVLYFSLKHGLLRCKKNFWVGAQVDLHNKIIVAVHNSPMDGHLGISVALID